MPSDSKKKDAQRKKDARNKKVNGGKSDDTKNGVNGVAKAEMTEEETLCALLEDEARINSEARSCTGKSFAIAAYINSKHSLCKFPGTLAVHPKSRDLKIENFSITFFGAELLQDTMLGKPSTYTWPKSICYRIFPFRTQLWPSLRSARHERLWQIIVVGCSGSS